MAASNQQQIDEKMKNISLDEKIPVENEQVVNSDKYELSVEDTYMIDCLNQLDDEETDVDKIANFSHQLLLAAAIKNTEKILKECTEDGKVSLDEEKMKKKKFFSTNLLWRKFKNVKRKIIRIFFFLDYGKRGSWFRLNVFIRKNNFFKWLFKIFFNLPEAETSCLTNFNWMVFNCFFEWNQ